MDQSELRSWESRCTQEEPPACRSACPLHVDVRDFCAHMAAGRTDKAWATLCRSLPLPSFMARICDAPCKRACLRNDAGGAIELAELERACAGAGPKTPPLHVPPSRGRKAVIMGGDMAALTAAWDLARKGVEVTLHCPAALDAVLPGLPAASSDLAAARATALQAECDALRRMGVTLHEHVTDPQAIVEAARAADIPVFIAPEWYATLLSGEPQPDAVTLGTTRLGVFAAPLPEASDEAGSPVYLAALGRRAAISMDRLFQNASLAAGREREGVFATRLYTNLAGVEPASPVPAGPTGYMPDDAKQEAARCLQCECMECVKNCAYLAEFGSYPKQYTRRIYNNESIVMGTRQANTMINSCMTCGLCATLCPEGFDMGALCLQSRQGMVQRGKMPQTAHEFALRDMAFANSEDCVIARHAPGTETSEWLFFPGCQMTASMPDAVERTWQWLRSSLTPDAGNVGLLLHCCGAPAQWAGRVELYEQTIAIVRARWETLGSPALVTACPTCTDMLRKALPQAVVASLWEVMAEKAAQLPASPVPEGAPLVLHDPCNTRHDAPLRGAVRHLLAHRNITVAEPELTGEKTECCGFGGLSENANPALGKRIREGRVARLDAASPADAVTYCAMCRDMLARTGRRVMHMLDLLLPPDKDTCCDTSLLCGARSQAAGPYTGAAPSYSERREMRVRLKERLGTTFWQEAGRIPAPWEAVQPDYTPQALEIMAQRRILDSDVRKVLHAMSVSGAWLENVSQGAAHGHRLAVFRPSVVTYWVEFTLREDGGYLVHNVWSHRMRIVPPAVCSDKEGAA